MHTTDEKMSVFDWMMLSFITIVVSMYLYDMTKLAVNSLNGAPTCHAQVVCNNR